MKVLKQITESAILRDVEGASNMAYTDLQGFKGILETMLGSIEQPLRRRDEIAIENAPDTIDRVQQAAERELAICQIESSFSRLQNIRLALERIADGSYGTCQRCDNDISEKRLQAVPWAACCVRCQDIADREHIDRASEFAGQFVQTRDVA
jgi:DnaK suppressor protein